MNSPEKRFYLFDSFRLDPLKRLLLRDGEAVAIPSKIFNTLLTLIESQGQVVHKDDLMTRIWPDTIVEEANLTVYISTLRKILGESKNEHRYIVTVPGQGYQFVGAVRQVEEDDEVELLMEKHTSAHISIREIDESVDDELPIQAEQPAPLKPAPAPRLFGWKLPIVSVLALLLLSAIGYWWFSGSRWKGQPRTEIKTIAVLPFRLLSSDGADEYLGVALADALIMRLSRVKEATVRPTSAVLKFSRGEPDSVAAGRELGVDAVLEGSIRKLGQTVRVTVQLVSVADGRPLWADKFDEQVAAVFTMEDKLSTKVAEALALNLTSEEKVGLTKRYTANFEAYQEYLRGRYEWSKRTPDGLQKGIAHFNRAIELDSHFALAYAGLADAYALSGFRVYGGLSPHEAMPQAKRAALQALELDSALAEAHASLGLVKSRYDWDWAGAESEFKRALELKPGYALAHQWYSDLLWVTGRGDEAFAEYKLADQADPSSIAITATATVHFYYRREYDRAMVRCRKMLATDSGAYLPHLILGLIYQQKEMRKESLAELQKAIAAGAGRAGQSALGCHYAATGQLEEALKLIEEFKQAAGKTYLDPLHVAAIYSCLRDSERTLEWIEKGYQDRSTAMVYLNIDPRYDWLHTNPRFVDLARRVRSGQHREQ